MPHHNTPLTIRRPPPRRGYTWIEFIVVATVLAVVLGLVLPGIQAAPESARRTQCQNNLKALALECLDHEQVHGGFPTGGWGGAWTGDADLGFSRKQPGGWTYNTLPFVQSDGWHDFGCGLATPQKNAANLQRLAVLHLVLNCPTRRHWLADPWINSWPVVNAGLPTMVGRTDYAANGGDAYTSPGAPLPPRWLSAPPDDELGPASLAEGGVNGSAKQTANATATFDNIGKTANGVIYCGSMVKLADITDGTSVTYLLGEKNVGPDWYLTGEDPGDSKAALVGDSEDVARWTFLPPLQDTPGYAARWRFGSAHPAGFNMAFCDGAVNLITYSIDPEIHRCLGNRQDGQPGEVPETRRAVVGPACPAGLHALSSIVAAKVPRQAGKGSRPAGATYRTA